MRSSLVDSSKCQQLPLLKDLEPHLNIKKIRKYEDEQQIQSISLEWNPRHQYDDGCQGSSTELEYDEENSTIEVCYVDTAKRRESEVAEYLSRFQEALRSMGLLQSLHIRRYPFREIPSRIGDFSMLHSLEIEQCNQLEYLPTSIGELRNLRLLVVQGCDNLQTLPKEIGKLICLNILLILECYELKTIPVEIRNLKSLEFLQIKNNHELRAIPTLPINLEMLEIYGIPLLKSLPKELEQLRKLKMLNLISLPSLETLSEGFCLSLSTLQHLEISCCPRFLYFESTSLPRLKSIRLSYVDDLQLISPSLKQLPNLDCVELSGLSTNVLVNFLSGELHGGSSCSAGFTSSAPKTISLRGIFHKNIDRRLRSSYSQIVSALPESVLRLDLENQGIESLQGFLNGCSSVGLPKGIRKLNLHGNPILESTQPKDQECLEKLLTSYPSLGWIGRDRHLYHLYTLTHDTLKRRKSGPRYYRLFSAYATYLLLFNRCGKQLLQEDPNNPSISLAVWPTVLAKVRKSVSGTIANGSSNRAVEYSVIYSFLHGPAFLSRPQAC